MNGKIHAVMLAGGDGIRLLPLTRRLFGEERPKQFCPLFGKRSLLALTRHRVAPLVAPEKTLFVVVERHRRFYEAELADVSPSQIVVQPASRGTSAAIVYSLLRISRTDPGALVAFLPTDHYYADEEVFALSLRHAFEIARQQPEFLILLGATPGITDTEYGWIEPGLCVKQSSTNPVFRVNRFREKPSPPVADELRGKGALLNTFVMVAHAGTFLQLIAAASPELIGAFTPLASDSVNETRTAERVYRAIDSDDFSHQVLSASADRLLVLQMCDAGWSDLGTEERVSAVMAREGLRAEPRTLGAFQIWLDAYRKRLENVY